jgi:hypothetical protein
MSFDLRIRFSGLCLMVPDPETQDAPGRPARFHVLLPDVKHEHGTGDGGGVHAHAGAVAGPAGTRRRAHVHPGDEGADGAGTTSAVDEGDTHEHAHGLAASATFEGGVEAASDAHDDGAGVPTGEAVREGESVMEIVEHLPRLIFDRAYQMPPVAGARHEFTRKLRCVDIRGKILEFLDIGIDPIDISLPREVASLDVVTGANRLPRKFVDSDDPGSELATRVTLGRGCVTDCTEGVEATLLEDEEPRRMTAQVEWTIRGIETADGALTISPGKLKQADAAGRRSGQAEAGGEIKLYPIGNTIHLEIWNVPKHELPGAPEKTEAQKQDLPAEHFAAFYDLLGVVAEDNRPVPIPKMIQTKVESECFAGETEGLGTPVVPNGLRCMVGQASLASS